MREDEFNDKYGTPFGSLFRSVHNLVCEARGNHMAPASHECAFHFGEEYDEFRRVLELTLDRVLRKQVPEGHVVVETKNYFEMVHEVRKLEALEACGVDDWGGYDEAMEFYRSEFE